MQVRKWVREHIIITITGVVHVVLDPFIVGYANEVAKRLSLNLPIPIDSFAVVTLMVMTPIVAVLTVCSIQEWRRKEVKKETIVSVYSQSNLPKLSKLLAKAKEIWFLGITLQELQQTKETLTNILSNNGKVRILICDPNSILMDQIDRVVASKKTKEKISSTLATLDELKLDLSSRHRDNLEIRLHRLIPTHSLIIIDPTIDSGAMQVEPYPYGIDREERRVLKLSKKRKGQRESFQVYLNSYERMWNDAATYA